MNSSRRWVYHFIGALECVRCRKKGDLTLRHYNGQRVDSEHLTLEQIRAMLPRIDVWCSDCPVRVGVRVAGPGRQKHKIEAAHYADVRVGTRIASYYDLHVIGNGYYATKKDLFSTIKKLPCMSCQQNYPEYIMSVVKGDKVLTYSGIRGTMHEVIEQLEGSWVVCLNCEQMLIRGDKEEPEAFLSLDENFWLSHFSILT